MTAPNDRVLARVTQLAGSQMETTRGGLGLYHFCERQTMLGLGSSMGTALTGQGEVVPPAVRSGAQLAVPAVRSVVVHCAAQQVTGFR